MSLITAFADGLTNCVAPGFTFPGVSCPGIPFNAGFPNFALSAAAPPFAGFNYILGFIPPDPHHLPSIPSIGDFIAPFMASMAMPTNYPALSLSFGGVSISIPSAGTGISPFPLQGPFDPSFGFNVGGTFAMMFMAIAAPFLICKQIITGIINNLTVTLPTLSAIQAIISGMVIGLGFGSTSLPPFVLTSMLSFGLCLATAIFTMLGNIL